MIADTSFIIDILREDEFAWELLNKFFSDKKTIYITSLTIFELWFWIYLSGNPTKEEKKVLKIVNDLPILNFDREAGKISGKINADLINKGKPIKTADVLIASIAINNNKTLITRDVKHFSKIKNLKVISY